MQNFYHKRKAAGFQVPHIMGLTASPVMRSDPLSLIKIEETLDAICRTPIKHRAELRLQVKLPVLSQLSYQPLAHENSLASYTRTINSLGRAFRDLKISDDPYIIGLLQENTDRSRRMLEKARMNHKTWCHDQIKSLHATTLKICSELGAWSADYYASEVISKVKELAEEAGTPVGIWDVTNAEKQYLANALKGVEITRCTKGDNPAASLPLVTDKVRKLIEILVRKSKSVEFSGIIFVQERALAAVLAHLLSVHPETRNLFRLGTIVGTSAHNYRSRNMGELIDSESQKNVLSLFKSGRMNLVIATSILEEGIDVPACNTVICFQKPTNLKSFLQRRGRARQRDSELILLLETADSITDKATEWQQLELDMGKHYEDEMRILEEVLLREDAEQHDNRTFKVESTGALLDIDSAVAHLYHFCATLPATEFVDLRPEFICSEDETGFIRATLILPVSVNEKVRTAESEKSWMSEKNAIKDVAFQAYVNLYRAGRSDFALHQLNFTTTWELNRSRLSKMSWELIGPRLLELLLEANTNLHTGLVNENLLPLLRHDAAADELKSSMVEKRASIVNVCEQLNPWIDIARAWERPEAELYQATITVGDLDAQLYLPAPIPEISPFHIYWDAKTDLLVTSGKSALIVANSEMMTRIWNDTWSLLNGAFGGRFSIQQRRVIMPFSTSPSISLKQQMGQRPITKGIEFNHHPRLIRDRFDRHVAYIFHEFLPNKPPLQNVQNPYEHYDATPDGPHLSLRKLPRRSDFLHKILPGSGPLSSKPHSVILPIERCIEDNIPFKFIQFGLLIPSITQRFGVFLLARALSTTLLRELGISNLSLVVTAISASSANESTNYQRL
jgi:hypothetical protein